MNQVQDLQVETGDSPFIKQLPLALEKTGIEKVDKLIEAEERRLKLLENDLKKAPYAEKKRIQQKVNASRRIIRDLRVSLSAEAAITEAHRLAKQTIEALKENEETLKDGSINPKYMSIEDLNNAYRDLVHFRNFTTLDEIIETMKQDKRKDILEAALKETKTLIDRALFGSNSIKEKMMERLVDLANEKNKKEETKFQIDLDK